jgi:AraC family transcriptional regulator
MVVDMWIQNCFLAPQLLVMLPRFDFMDPQSRARLLGDGVVLNSAEAGWRSMYFEQRHGGLLETVEHVIEGHCLMVKLNPMSRAERKIDGRLQMEIQRRGDTVYIPDGSSHQVRYTTPLGRLHVMVLPKSAINVIADELGAAPFVGAPRFAHEDRFVLEISQSINDELANGDPHGELYAQTYARVLAAHIVTRYGKAACGRLKLPALTPAKLRRLDEYVESEFSRPISLSELAAQAGLSEYYFCRVFKQATGSSPYKYVLQKRLEFAMASLRDCNESIQDIAFAAGFGDPIQFAKHFRRATGLTPTAYRAGYAKKPRVTLLSSNETVPSMLPDARRSWVP